MRKRPEILVVAGTNSSHGRRILRGVLDFGNSRRVPWRVYWTGLSEEMDSMPFDGVVFPILSRPALLRAKRLRRQGIPVVNVSGAIQDTGFPTVISDNHAIGFLAARHLRERLYRHFAFVGAEDQRYSAQRLAGFLEGTGLSSVPTAMTGSPGRLARFLKSLPPGTGIMAVHDGAAREVVDAAERCGWRIPDRFGIIGVDVEEEVGLALGFRLSTVDPGSHRLGSLAASLLEKMLHGETVQPREQRIKPLGVIERDSTGFPTSTEPRLCAALRLIEDQCCTGLTVAQIARQCGTGRRTLENLFRHHLQIGVYEFVQRRRMERAQQLLQTGDLSISDVSDRCGFPDIYRFSAAFSRRMGMSPTAWRKTRMT